MHRFAQKLLKYYLRSAERRMKHDGFSSRRLVKPERTLVLMVKMIGSGPWQRISVPGVIEMLLQYSVPIPPSSLKAFIFIIIYDYRRGFKDTYQKNYLICTRE